MKASTLPKYLVKRKLGFYAVMEIPLKVQPVLGKRRFLQSLETREQSLAERRLHIVAVRWKAAIEKARGTHDPSASVLWEVMEWRKELAATTDEDTRTALEDAITDKLEAVEARDGPEAAQDAAQIVFGNSVPLKDQVEAWMGTTRHLNPKTRDIQENAVRAFCDHFKSSHRIDKTSVKEYLLVLRMKHGLSDQTIGARLSFLRSFMGYVDETYGTGLVSLFTSKALGKAPSAKTTKQRAWTAFTAAEVSKLYEAARAGKKVQDQTLADLIALAAYTGCRIEELGQLRPEDITEQSIKIGNAKTAAGIREVPMHPVLWPLVQRLLKDPAGDFLVPGSAGSYDKRTNALGTRFGRLKTAMGFSDRHVFHSIRKTVVSQLEQAGVGENVTADIVGHEKPRITYGLYSSGTSLSQKAEALMCVAYPSTLGMTD